MSNAALNPCEVEEKLQGLREQLGAIRSLVAPTICTVCTHIYIYVHVCMYVGRYVGR